MSARSAILCLSLSVLFLAGCATNQGPSEQAGMIIGGVLGGVIGAQIDGDDRHTAAIIAGTLAGAAIGGAIGRTMDEVDRMNAGRALETVRTGVPSRWRNPDTGNYYSIVPTRTFDSRAGPCREYTIEAIVGGQPETVYGTACRQTDGSWRVQN